MSEILNHLAMRIRNELPEIEHTLKRAKQTGDDYYLDGVALNLHSFYSLTVRGRRAVKGKSIKDLIIINFGPTGVDVKCKYRKNIGQDQQD